MPRAGGVISLVGAGGKTTLMFRIARELAAAGETVLTTTTTRICRPEAAQSAHVIVAARPSAALPVLAYRLRRSRHVTAAAGCIPEGDKLAGYPPESVDAFRAAGLFRWILVEADGAARRPLKAPAAHEPVIPACSDWVVAVAGMAAVGRPLDPRWVFRPERFGALAGVAAREPVTPDAIATVLLHPQGMMKGLGLKAARCVFLNQLDLPGAAEAARTVCAALARSIYKPVDRILIGSAAENGTVAPAEGC
ncbi:MAG: putative selenium-dependent hydroxylase accessory protein YqeC [Desulfobacteraceae bacterium]|nr:putative selenium-dependent hydroxylase accessory protein YqeC [Desulfobacteraceae bacterium]